VTPKIVSEMTYNVSNGTLNPTIPIRPCFFFVTGSLAACIALVAVRLLNVNGTGRSFVNAVSCSSVDVLQLTL